MLMHLGATERFYQIHTFENKKWGDWSKADSDKWTVASGLEAKARKEIKGNFYDFYLNKLSTIRENTLSEFAKRDNEWLLTVDKEFPWGPQTIIVSGFMFVNMNLITMGNSNL